MKFGNPPSHSTHQLEFLRPRQGLAGFRLNNLRKTGLPLEELGEFWNYEGDHIEEHSNMGWEVYLQVRGVSRWKIGRTRFELGRGGYYLIPPGIRHSLERFELEAAHFYFVVYDPSDIFQRTDLWKSWPKSFVYGSNGFSLEPSFRALIREISMDDPHRKAAIQAHLTVLSLEVTRLISHQTVNPFSALHTHRSVARARELLENQPGHPWKLAELAAICGISVQHLIDLFRRESGLTPMRFLHQTRLALGERLLAGTDAPITQIAMECGFSSSQHFATAFAQEKGIAPRDFRKSAMSPKTK